MSKCFVNRRLVRYLYKGKAELKPTSILNQGSKNMEEGDVTEQQGRLYNQIDVFLKKKEHKEILNFAYSNGFSIATFVIFLWQVIKFMYYTYMCGRFSAYDIDLSYIIVKEENIVFQIIKIIGIGLFIFITNYVVYFILTEKNKEKKESCFLIKFLATLIWLAFMMLLIVFILSLFSHINIFELIIDLKNYPKENFASLLIIFLFTILVNIIGLELGYKKIIDLKVRRYRLKKEYIKYRKNKKVDKGKLKKYGYIITKLENTKVRKKTIKYFIINIIMIVAFIVIMLFYMWFMGRNLAEKQLAYKVIFESTEDVNTKNYILQAGEDRYICYPIIFETEDHYILTRLVKVNDTYSLEQDYQKIINKEGIQTFNIENIKNNALVGSKYIGR